ncbi:DUF2256 domain-containing protein [Thalassotalea litorea]|uniref:DUF2256 domain-containing protein n=1 Tax=Thalassotalea litorea TaxID=2020715 RepID=A0A5R9IBP1_9GAMM|nr:DUF2256 domain-containing protein [Thalassotalea litorea]
MRAANNASKLCPVCQRCFEWRKKWERDWDKVKYCSKRCAGMRNMKVLSNSVKRASFNDDRQKARRQ